MKAKSFDGKGLALSLLMGAGTVLIGGFPIAAEANKKPEPVEHVWHVLRNSQELTQTLRTFGQPDPYRWFRQESGQYTPVSLFDDPEEEIVAPIMPLNFQQMVDAVDIPADDPSLIQSTPWEGEEGITQTVAEIMERENANPSPKRPKKIKRVYPSREGLPQHPLSPPISQYPPTPQQANPNNVIKVMSKGGGDVQRYTWQPWQPGNSWQGTQISEASFYRPPDSVGAAGPTQVVVATNGRIRCYNKNGTLGPLNVNSDNFFASVGGGSSGAGDPRVRFDRATNRWFFVTISFVARNRVMVAVSSGPTITSSSSFTFFGFQADLVAPIGDDTNSFFDYCTLGVDNNALYVGGNVFGNGRGFLGGTGFVIRKSSVLGSGPIVVTPFRRIGSGTGIRTPYGVHNDNPNATEGYFIGTDAAAFGRLVMRRVSNPGGSPTISANIPIVVPATTFPGSNGVPALGTAPGLDGLDDRLFDAQIHTNRLTGVSTLWTAHSFRVSASGVATNSGSRHGSRWYQLGNLTGTPNVVQSGTVFDGSATPSSYWIPGIIMNGQGHAILGSSTAAAAKRAEVAIASRLASDTLGTTRSPIVVQASTTPYNLDGGANKPRWGDYSSTFVDPADDMTFWSFQEYCNATDSWAVRVVKLLAPAPAAIASIAPNTIEAGTTASIVVTGTSDDGTGFFDPDVTGLPDPGLVNRLRATFSGTGVTVNGVTFTSPISLTINVTAGAGAALGTRSLTIINPDNQQVTASNILTVISTETGTVSGTISLEAIVNPAVSITFEFQPQPSGAPFTRTVTLDASGGYSLTTVPTGNYNVGIKGARWLRATQAITVTTATVTLNATLRGGDSNNDNVVDITDLLALIASYNQVQGASGSTYSVTVDFDNDGSNDISDLLLLIGNYNQLGDPSP